MRPHGSPTPTPFPIDQIQLMPLYKALPFLQVIPKEILWGAVGAMVTALLRWLYGLVMERRIQTTKIEVMTALGEHQARVENLVRVRFEKWDDQQTNQMIEIVKLEGAIKEISEDIHKILGSMEAQAKHMHKLEMRMNRLEGNR